jgi:hypothetical protein
MMTFKTNCILDSCVLSLLHDNMLVFTPSLIQVRSAIPMYVALPSAKVKYYTYESIVDLNKSIQLSSPFSVDRLGLLTFRFRQYAEK